jgi:hypothetical protein
VTDPPPENSVFLRLANGPLAAPVLGRVVSMVLARADCPVTRLDDALTLCDALSAHAPVHASDGHLTFTVSTDRQGVELRVGELAEQGASKLLADATVPGVGNVLERMSDALTIAPSSDRHLPEELILTLHFD